MVVCGGVKQRRNIGYRDQEPLSNDSCVNCRGQESEAKGIPMERFLIEWENKSWMSNRIWNIYGWRPLVETKVRNGATDRLKIHVLTPSKGYSRNFFETQKTQRCASKNCSIFVSKFDENISLSKEREKEREYYVGLLFFNLLNPLIGETRVKSPLFTCQSFELVKFFLLTFIHSSLFYRVTTF